MPRVVIAGPIIEAGQSLSNGINCSAGSIIRITTPAAWDLANLSFQISTDGVAYTDLYLPREGEVVIACGAKQALNINPVNWPAAAWVKFRSGDSAHPIVQTAQRKFETVIDTKATTTTGV